MWSGETVAIFGGGPSLTQEQVNACRGFRSIAINDAYLLAPWADVLYFPDVRWWKWHRNREEFKRFSGMKVSIDNHAPETVTDPDVTVLKDLSFGSMTDGRLSREPGGVYTGRNAGYQAINVAVLFGAKRIILLGYDMKSKDGRTHWFGDHPVKTDPQVFRQYRMEFVRMAPTAERMGVEILNATPGSDLKAFSMVSLESLVPSSYGAALPT